MNFRSLFWTVVALGLGYGGFWYYMAFGLEEKLEAAAAQARDDGIVIEYGAIRLAGFPYRIEAHVAGFSAATRSRRTGWQWQIDDLVITTQAWDPTHIIALSPLATYRSSTRSRYSLRQVRASLIFTGAMLERLSIEAAGGATFTLMGDALTAERLEAHWRRRDIAGPAPTTDGLQGPKLADLQLQLDNIDLGALGSPVLGDRITKAVFAATLHGEALPAWRADDLARWRDAGGTLDITTLDLIWGGTTINGNGSLTLDEKMRPLGAVGLKMDKPTLAIDHLAATGAISKSEARSAREVLAMMASAGTRGVGLSLTLQEGMAFLGPITLGEVEPLTFGGR